MSEKTVGYGFFKGHRGTLKDLQACVGEGWADIIETCFNACVEHDVSVAQVKEKFGGLRFYVGGAPQEVHDIIDECETLSYKTCEICGDIGKPREGGWIKTLCDEHEMTRYNLSKDARLSR